MTNVILPDPKETTTFANNKESLKLLLLRLNAPPRNRNGLLNALATARNRKLPVLGRVKPSKMYKRKKAKEFNNAISQCYEEIIDFVEEGSGDEDV